MLKSDLRPLFYAMGVESFAIFGNADAESIFIKALNFLGMGAVAIISLYLLREQGRETREQLDKITKCFMDTFEQERKANTEGAAKIVERIANDHQQCRIEHGAIIDRMTTMVEKQKEIVEYLKSSTEQQKILVENIRNNSGRNRQ